MAFHGVEDKAGTIDYERVNGQYASSSYKYERNFCPKAILQPSSIEDIQVVIRNARDAGVPVALRTGGHQYSGASSTDEKGILLNLKHSFRLPGVNLELNEFGDKAFIPASVSYKLGELFDFFRENGIFMPTGQCREVHVGGHVQSGGFDMLARSIGLLVDYVREITIVNHEGDVVKVSKESQPDLFFGISFGSPGNFGVVTHYKIEVQRDKHFEGSQGLWIAFFYRDKTYKALVDILRRKAEDPNLPHGYDFTVNATSRSADLAVVYPGTKDQLRKAAGQVEDQNRLDKLLEGKYAMIVCWAQFLKIKGEPAHDSSLFEEIKNVPFDADKPPIVQELGIKNPMPVSQIYTKWFLDKAREFDLPYIKRTYTTKKLMSPNWSAWFQGRVSAILGTKKNPKGSPGSGSRPSCRYSKPQAEEWQKKNDEGLKQHFSETDRRLLWGSWGDWYLSKPEVWKCYYDIATFRKLQGIRRKADPYGTFSCSPFAVPRA